MKKSRNLLLALGVITMATLFQGCVAQKSADVKVTKPKGHQYNSYVSGFNISNGWINNKRRNLDTFITLSHHYKGAVGLELANSTLHRRGGWDGRTLGRPDSFTFNGISPIECKFRSVEKTLFHGVDQWLACKFDRFKVLRSIAKSNSFKYQIKAKNPSNLIGKTYYEINDPKQIEKFRKAIKCFKKQAKTCEEPTQKR